MDKVCTKTLEASVFDLAKHIINGRGEAALKLVNNLLKDGTAPAQIYPLIADTYVDIYRVKNAVKSGKKPTDIAEEFGYPKNRVFLLNNAATNGRNLDDEKLGEILNELLKFDALIKHDVKLSGNSAKISLETLIIKILKISNGGRV